VMVEVPVVKETFARTFEMSVGLADVSHPS
jgi:hypothetical protein